MCGRFTLSVEISRLISSFSISLIPEGFEYRKRFNIAPTQVIPVIIGEDRREITTMRWGMVPHWAKDLSIGNKMINARAETVDQKPAFKNSFLRHRCLIPADGFYEWKKQNGSKIPLRIMLPDKELFAFAGLWAHWTSPDGKEVCSCSIVTTAANEFVREIHNRMPVILSDEKEYSTWLGFNDPASLKQLLKPYEGPMSAYSVSTKVNSPRYDEPDIIQRQK